MSLLRYILAYYLLRAAEKVCPLKGKAFIMPGSSLSVLTTKAWARANTPGIVSWRRENRVH